MDREAVFVPPVFQCSLGTRQASIQCLCRFDPGATISAEQTTTEQERVLFIKQAVLLLLQNSRLRLNPRRLYQVLHFGKPLCLAKLIVIGLDNTKKWRMVAPQVSIILGWRLSPCHERE